MTSGRPEKAEDIRLVVDTIPGLVWSTRPDGSAEFFNQRWLEYTGLSAEQALDWGWKVAIHSDDLPRILEYISRSPEPETPIRGGRALSALGWRISLVSFPRQPIIDGSGNVVRWYGTNTDLEDRKRAEDALRLRRTELSSHCGWDRRAGSYHDIDRGSPTVNRQVLDYFGKTVEQLKGWSTRDAVHPDDLPGVALGLEAVGRDGVSLRRRSPFARR